MKQYATYIKISPRTSVGHEMVDSQRGALDAVVIISYPTSVSGIIVLFKTPPKYRKLNKKQIKTPQKVILYCAWHNGSYTMMAKRIKTLESHYTMIQFLVKDIN